MKKPATLEMSGAPHLVLPKGPTSMCRQFLHLGHA